MFEILVNLHCLTLVDQLVEPKTTKVTLSSTLKDLPASNAVDGNFSKDISSCSHTDVNKNQKEAWLFIDLQIMFSIKSVKFWYSEYLS